MVDERLDDKKSLSQRLFEYLVEEAEAGTNYTKAKYVAKELDTSSKRVGVRMKQFNDHYQEKIEEDAYMRVLGDCLPSGLDWGYSNGTSWQISPFAHRDVQSLFDTM